MTEQTPSPKLTPPSPALVRDELEALFLGEILGPAQGEREEIDQGEPIQHRYLAGKLAPRNDRISEALQDELAVAEQSNGEEGVAEPAAPARDSLFPSAMGISFTLDGGTRELRVSAQWGWYKREKSEDFLTEAGNPKTIWRRYPMAGEVSIAVKAGGIAPLELNPEQSDVVVRGRMRKDDAGLWHVSLFLVNNQVYRKGEGANGEHWLLQPELAVMAADGAPVFVRRRVQAKGEHMDQARLAENRALEMLYRDQVEFATGHGVAVAWDLAQGDRQRAVRLATRVAPSHEVPQTTTATAEDHRELAGLDLDMRTLAEADDETLLAKLRRLPEAYGAWIGRQHQRAANGGLMEHAQAVRDALGDCEAACDRIAEGVDCLAGNGQAREAFRFANRAMWLQRIHGIQAEAVRRGQTPDHSAIDQPANRSWRLFQLAFVLLNLPGSSDLHHPERSPEASATADLLWFPTGGGKTEAYLGLSAYVLGLRRLQGPVGGRRGDTGVGVLMRYTLRLLTLQQFQRATALICACEHIRREALARDDDRWGRDPFRIGLWVGAKTTPNTTGQSAVAVGALRSQYSGSGTSSPAQLTHCPWCGAHITPGSDIRVEGEKKGRGRTLLFCGDPLGQCEFSAARSQTEGLPVLVVDDEIYRHPPSLLISTVDKFAQLPWRGETQMLFGRVDRYCGRHGFLSPSIEHASKHTATSGFEAVTVIEHPPLRPPDLIIQDELHLISGPLGSLVGLYETAIDRLCSWEVDGQWVRPKVIASTATIRQARDQVHDLFMRRVAVFPPHGIDLTDNFFSLQRPPSDAFPGRRYLGICAPGERLKSVLIRTYLPLLAAGQTLYQGRAYGEAADPWMTLVGYFNSLRELGGMRRLVDDDIRARLKNMESHGFERRNLIPPYVEELTSRKQAGDIPELLDWLEVGFDPAVEAERKARSKGGGKRRPDAKRDKPLDVLLATNMLSVGVDVKRLGLMVVAGQPKNTAEYIQATSRVGRNTPGLVCTVYNWARPRDLSHFERFGHYHATFYQHVEALSVTPFASGAVDRGIAGVLVGLIRLLTGEYNANLSAQNLDRSNPVVQEALDTICTRVEQIAGKGEAAEVRALLNAKLDLWQKEAQTQGSQLGYKKVGGITRGLLQQPGDGEWRPFTVLNSLRDVEPSVGLILKEP